METVDSDEKMDVSEVNVQMNNNTLLKHKRSKKSKTRLKQNLTNKPEIEIQNDAKEVINLNYYTEQIINSDEINHNEFVEKDQTSLIETPSSSELKASSVTKSSTAEETLGSSTEEKNTALETSSSARKLSTTPISSKNCEYLFSY